MGSGGKHVPRSNDSAAESTQRDRFALLGQVAARGAHEINGQLMALFHVLASARDLAQRAAAAGTASTQAEALLRQLADGDEALRRITRISQTITSYARPPVQESEQFAFDEVVEGALRLGEMFLNGVAITRARLTSAARVSGHADGLAQIVLNLLINAGQAIQGGGGTAIWVDTELAGAWALVRVRDDGPGVSRDLRERIFEPYVTTKATRGGTGLGLAICRELATRDGGSIRLLESDSGATFEVLLPLTEIGARRPDPTAPGG
jgi:C4-dicarboxylate-specific signal transduction histidine kinase